MSQEKLTEILEKLYEEGSFEGECRDIHPDRIKEAHSAILAWIKEEIVPKKLDIFYLYGEDIYANGFNHCREEILNKINENT
jgi:hypothetical protein